MSRYTAIAQKCFKFFFFHYSFYLILSHITVPSAEQVMRSLLECAAY